MTWKLLVKNAHGSRLQYFAVGTLVQSTVLKILLNKSTKKYFKTNNNLKINRLKLGSV